MTRVLTVSQNSINDIHADHHVPLDRMHVVPVGVDQNLFRPLPDVERVQGRLITTASADVTMKGLRYLLEAVAKLRTERHVELVVIGRLKEGGPSARDDRRARPPRRRHLRHRRARTTHHRALLRGRGRRRARRSTRASPSRPSRPCPAACRWWPPPAARCPRSSAPTTKPPSWSPRATATPWRADRTGARRPRAAGRIGAAGRQRVIDRWTWRHTAVGTVEHYRALLDETAATQARRPGGAGQAPRYRGTAEPATTAGRS